jgi:hypothetical protein
MGFSFHVNKGDNDSADCNDLYLLSIQIALTKRIPPPPCSVVQSKGTYRIREFMSIHDTAANNQMVLRATIRRSTNDSFC